MLYNKLTHINKRNKMLEFKNIVTPLLNRRIRKSAEQSFTARIDDADFTIKSVKEAGQFLGYVISDELNIKLENEIAKSNFEGTITDIRYMVTLNIIYLLTGKKVLYKIAGTLSDFEKFKTYLDLNMDDFN